VATIQREGDPVGGIAGCRAVLQHNRRHQHGRGVVSMECFAHPDTHSVGICKTCGKAVCRACAVDTGFALACSQACAKEASDVHEMNQRGKKIYGIGVAPRKLPSAVLVWLVFATLFSGFGVLTSFRNHQPEWFTLLFGGAFFYIAWLAYRRAKDVGIQC
jgi:hypothetical protein